MTWVIDCGHWHCPDRMELRHAHLEPPETCEECQAEPPESERARKLRERAEAVGTMKTNPNKER
jgi:hypothetical protein